MPLRVARTGHASLRLGSQRAPIRRTDSLVGMAYARFGPDSDVYVFAGGPPWAALECCDLRPCRQTQRFFLGQDDRRDDRAPERPPSGRSQGARGQRSRAMLRQSGSENDAEANLIATPVGHARHRRTCIASAEIPRVRRSTSSSHEPPGATSLQHKVTRASTASADATLTPYPLKAIQTGL